MKYLNVHADPWFCISCTSNILPFSNRHRKAKETITAPTNLFHHNKIFQLIKIKNLNNLTDEPRLKNIKK